MGRQKWTTRLTVEGCLAFPIDSLTRDGLFRAPLETPCTSVWKDRAGEVLARISSRLSKRTGGGLFLRLCYSLPGPQLPGAFPTIYEISLAQTKCQFGGVRYWFICPVVVNGIPCRKRVGRLYLPPGARYFGCRTCYNLSYRSRQRHNKTLDPLLRWTLPQIQAALHSSDPKQVCRGWRALNEQRRRILARPRFRALALAMASKNVRFLN